MNARFCDDQTMFQIQVRELEMAFGDMHDDLLNWARWSMGRLADRPHLARPAIWDLPGDHDPNMDEEAVAESLPIPVRERAAIDLDTIVNDLDRFPAVWCRIIKANYLPPQKRNPRNPREPQPRYVAPEWQRPSHANVSGTAYLQQFRLLMAYLERRMRPEPEPEQPKPRKSPWGPR
jgi:hypothetical protein